LAVAGAVWAGQKGARTKAIERRQKGVGRRMGFSLGAMKQRHSREERVYREDGGQWTMVSSQRAVSGAVLQGGVGTGNRAFA
jgi:hypothetical protein